MINIAIQSISGLSACFITIILSINPYPLLFLLYLCLLGFGLA